MASNIWKRKFLNVAIRHLIEPETRNAAPPIIDTEWLNTGIPADGYPHVFEPVYQQESIVQLRPARRFVGFEKVGLRWMIQNESGALVQR